MAHQSLYRRYRPQNFAQLKGQSHVTAALKSAVSEGRHGHAYMFSGPRGTGKTSTARVLAKALNCPDIVEGEPCGVCESCMAIEQGKSFDLHELDAASHNKVDDIRDLTSRVNLGSPGKTKVYILDEVHMLSSGAENALLKTLEEPPEHVVFILATTEPHKVADTIRSRTQQFQFSLLSVNDLQTHVQWVIEDAGLEVDAAGVDYVLERGAGSARDTLSALDTLAAAGAMPETSDIGLQLCEAIGTANVTEALTTVQKGLKEGQEPRIIATLTINTLRNAFLLKMGSETSELNDRQNDKISKLADEISPAKMTESLQMLGTALIEMRQSPDPRIPLETTLLKLCFGGAATQPAGPATGDSSGHLEGRIAKLESQIASLNAGQSSQPTQGTQTTTRSSASQTGPGSANTSASVSPTPTGSAPTSSQAAPATVASVPASGFVDPAQGVAPPADTAEPAGGGSAPASRAREVLNDTLKASKSAKPPKSPRAGNRPSSGDTPAAATPQAASEPDDNAPATTQAAQADAAPAPVAAASGASVTISVDVVKQALEDRTVGVSQKARVRFKGGDISIIDDATIGFVVPNEIHLDRCGEVKGEVEEALSKHFGRAIAVNLRVEASTKPASNTATTNQADSEEEEVIDLIDDLEDAPNPAASGVERIQNVFPGATIVEPKQAQQ